MPQIIYYLDEVARHGLRTSNEGINQRYLKNWADVADKICFGRTLKFGIGIEFLPLWASVVCLARYIKSIHTI